MSVLLCCTCCSASNLKAALLITANTPMSFCISYSPATTHHLCTALMSRTLCKRFAAVLLCKQPENCLACHCKYTYEFLHFIQCCNNPSLMHSTHVKHPLQALCCTCCSASNLKTALLVTANTPMSFCTSYSPAIPLPS